MDRLTPIPSAPGARWRRWRAPLCQLLVFLVTCVLISLTWRQMQRPGSFPGQVEVVETLVSSGDAGFITNLWVHPLQEIKAGDLVAEVITTDPRTVNNRLEAMRDRMRLTALEMDPMLRRERSALAFEQLSLDANQVKTEMEIARVKLIQAMSQFDRDEKSFKMGLIAAQDFELSRRNKESFEVEVKEKSNFVVRANATLERLRSMADLYVPGGENDPIEQALALEEAKMRVFEAKVAPARLLATTNGIVTGIFRRAGERVLPADPVAIITCAESERIIGFVPYQFGLEPRLGMEVEITSRGPVRHTGLGCITGISPQIQTITNAIVPPVGRHVTFAPMSRLISISMPAGLGLLPGEPVDLRFTGRTHGSANSAPAKK
jgi:multidrug resistance efflux pump